ncbi:cell death-inducing p53-target protein 1 homolog [Folsomia candida]|uniref:Lipopolysaccharide-induced tumor necrosis factor-alpha factor n=1 Tax=Folsomia candida TaxID=158441 RepID=A0A226EFH1_FOLCA|nr:cell death-inducing p53-target protein 1 homolog [Folsomia candida]XP_021952299.1 cell death-inducing p53-target protein 1 homolog [Folsomia candida]XP_021952300.1 cell death-inducing p53-target protein 1 homolog [Folsomia candida]OXA56120.1 Lipopolysaccharide-induced tumor necrosis factor-alpha factor [Folsomia candida]
MADQGDQYPTEKMYPAPAPPPYFQGAMPMQQYPPMPSFAESPPMQPLATAPPPPPVTFQPVQTPVIIPRVHEPVVIDCPHCRAKITTSVRYGIGMMVHLFAVVLCFFGCWPCCLIPYCLDPCKDTTHECPACGRHLSVVKRL